MLLWASSVDSGSVSKRRSQPWDLPQPTKPRKGFEAIVLPHLRRAEKKVTDVNYMT
ncbi:hypothetical protein GFS31_25680 [Leptolyngbya sp. BL0902]|nr:hypothetical protein GFS31_25680 [Leptolyngbya sp. BL0902]